MCKELIKLVQYDETFYVRHVDLLYVYVDQICDMYAMSYVSVDQL